MNQSIKFTEEIVDKILNELIYELFINRKKIKVLKKFQEAIAYPISKNDFLENMNNLMGKV